MKLVLTVHLDLNVLVLDVKTFLAAVRYVLRGIFPQARMAVSVEEPKVPLGTPETPGSTILN